MTHGQNETISIGPDRVFGIETKESLPQRVYDRGHGHWGSWMTRVGLLDRVHGERSDRIYGRELNCIFPIHELP